MYDHGKKFDLFQLIPRSEFSELCKKWEIDKGVRSFSTSQQVWTLVMTYLLRLESLREVELALGVPKSTLSDANATRPAGFLQELCELVLSRILIQSKSRKVRGSIRTLLAVDSTECQVHGSLSNILGWKSRGGGGKTGGKASSKLHVVWNINGEWIDDFRITDGRTHDLKAAQGFRIQPHSYYVFDRAYSSLRYWWKITIHDSHFVTRLKQMPRYRMKSFSVEREKKDAVGVLWDGSWKPTQSTLRNNQEIPKDIEFRHIIYRDFKTKKIFHFITSDWNADPQLIADIYKKRWAVELLFRWLKGHMNIRYLPFRNVNAVKTQLAAAVLTQLLIQLHRLKCQFNGSLWEFLRILRNFFTQEGIKRFRCTIQEMASWDSFLDVGLKPWFYCN